MIELNDTTLVCIDTKNYIQALLAIDKSLDLVNFQSCKFFTDKTDLPLHKISNGAKIEIVNIPKINSVFHYSAFCLLELHKYISSSFCLTVQHDGYVVNSNAWRDEFRNFDYIGAPWPTHWGYVNRVGNGGFSLKSRKFLEVVFDIFQNVELDPDKERDRTNISINEDYLACVVYYEECIKRGIKFADVELASHFSVEHIIPEMKMETFGFHDKFTDKTKRILNT